VKLSPTGVSRTLSEISESTKELNKLKVPLADLRAAIVQLMKEGYTEAPLGDFLVIIKSVIKDSKTS